MSSSWSFLPRQMLQHVYTLECESDGECRSLFMIHHLIDSCLVVFLNFKSNVTGCFPVGSCSPVRGCPYKSHVSLACFDWQHIELWIVRVMVNVALCS